MRCNIIFAPEAVDDFKRVSARDRSTIRDAIEIHLRHDPKKMSKNRIKRLRGISRPEYRLRVGEFRVFYDVKEDDWFDYKLENDPRFLERIASARQSLRAGKGIRIEDLPV